VTRNAWWSLAAWLVATPWRAAVGAETTHSFEKWEPEIAAFEQMDRIHPPPQGAVLFTGSSTIRLWKTLAQDFPEHRVINRGFGGSEITDATHFAERVIFPCAPRMILLRAGGNDLWNGKSPEQVFADFREFVAKVHAKLPGAEIVFISVSPSLARWKQAEQEKALNTRIAAYVRQQAHVKYVETYPMVLGPDGQPRPELFDTDKLHFNAAGYKLLAERVRPYLPSPAGANKSPSAKDPAGRANSPPPMDRMQGEREPPSS
jgi:lysophospholipase L1-like esterase